MGSKAIVICLAILIIPLTSATPATIDFQAEEGIIWFDCENTYVELQDSMNLSLNNSSDIYRHIDDGNYTLNFEDMDNCQGVVPLTSELPNLRPSPSSSFDSTDIVACNLSGATHNCEGVYVSGDLLDDPADVFAHDVSAGQILVTKVISSSAAIDVKFHFQNQTSEIMIPKTISLNVNTSLNSNEKSIITIPEDGRIIISVTSPDIGTVWALRTQLYNKQDLTELNHLDSIAGIGQMNFKHHLPTFESLLITNSVNESLEPIPLLYRFVYSENYSSEWINATIGDRIRSISESDYVEFSWDCDCIWFASMSRYRHYDAGWEQDAPSLRPLTATSDNSSYPLIQLDGRIETGELTLHMGDYRDMLRIETTGWNESIHLIEVIVEGDIFDLEVTIFDIDQKSWEELDSVTKSYSMNNIRASLEVGRGTHFVRIQHVNGSDSLDVNSEPVEWSIRITTAVIDEGEEPWFPPSDEVKDAAGVFYWLMGAIMIVPFLFFLVQIQRDKQFAEEFASKKNRLQWLSERLDKGEDIGSDLSRALRTMSSLEWEDSIRTWGKPEIRHITSGIDIALWTLDRRLSNTDGIPILVGIMAKESEWSVAAIRFEAPEGEAWVVTSVEPKLLYRKDEIFLDTIAAGSRIFIKLELKGNASSLDVHVSGIMNYEPIAAKPTKTMKINSEEE